MSYTLIRLRNLICSLFPRTVAHVERLRIACGYLPSLAKGGLRLPLPYMFKRGIIARFAARSGAKILVETGTYLGDTPWQLRHLFERIWTVEVHPPLAALAKNRFARQTHVTVIEADSRHALKKIVPQLDKPTVFWIDGHYSGGITGIGEAVCPILAELDTIFGDTKVPFTLLIDDARLFGIEEGYPKLEELHDYLARLPEPPLVWIENDIVFVIPKCHPLAAECVRLPFDTYLSQLY